jgi:hypothetical protein
MARRNKENAVDWEAIERQYRLGKKSNAQLAKEFGVENSSIGRRAKKYCWVANKKEEVAATTESLLIQAASGNANPNATPTQLEIKVAAQASADVVLKHRNGLSRLGKLRDKLLDEIEQVTDNLPLFVELGELMDESGPTDNGGWKVDKKNQIYQKVISMSGRVDDVKKLAEIDEKVRKGEREAFGIDKSEGGDGRFEDVLKRIQLEG